MLFNYQLNQKNKKPPIQHFQLQLLRNSICSWHLKCFVFKQLSRNEEFLINSFSPNTVEDIITTCFNVNSDLAPCLIAQLPAHESTEKYHRKDLPKSLHSSKKSLNCRLLCELFLLAQINLLLRLFIAGSSSISQCQIDEIIEIAIAFSHSRFASSPLLTSLKLRL